MKEGLHDQRAELQQSANNDVQRSHRHAVTTAVPAALAYAVAGSLLACSTALRGYIGASLQIVPRHRHLLQRSCAAYLPYDCIVLFQQQPPYRPNGLTNPTAWTAPSATPTALCCIMKNISEPDRKSVLINRLLCKHTSARTSALLPHPVHRRRVRNPHTTATATINTREVTGARPCGTRHTPGAAEYTGSTPRWYTKHAGS